jgi:hypothetical protein
MIVPPPQAGPPLPKARAITGAEPPMPPGKTSRSERAMLIAVAIMLTILFVAAVIAPHLPMVAEW